MDETRADGSVEERRGAFPRWMFPLVMVVALVVGGIWWSITLRQEFGPAASLRDGQREWRIDAQGQVAGTERLPSSLRDAVGEAVRTGRLPIAPGAPRARLLSELEATELEQAKGAAEGSHLVLGIIYAQAGLREEAAGEFRA